MANLVLRFSAGAVTADATIPDTIPAIAVQAERWASGTGATLLALGLPLLPGQVFPANLAQLSVWLGGVEIAVYLECLGAYPDGSARSLYIQASQTLTKGTPVTGEVRLAGGFLVARRTFVDNSSTFTNSGTGTSWNGLGLPQGAIVPRNAAQICGGMPYGRYIPYAEEVDFTGRAAAHAALLATVTSTVLPQAGFPHALANYDRPHALWGLWARTADSTYLQIGLSNMAAYLTQYAGGGANFALPETQQMTASILQWYLLTRDTTARDAYILGLIESSGNPNSNIIATVPRTSIVQWNSFANPSSQAGRFNSRIFGQLSAAIKANSAGKARVSSGLTYEQHAYDWLGRVTDAGCWNGSTWLVGGFASNHTTPKTVAYVYMSAMMCAEIIELCSLITPNATTTTALNAVKTSLDYFRTVSSPQMLIASTTGTVGFNYATSDLYDGATGTLAGVPTATDAQVDLNGHYAHLYAWRAANGGTSTDAALARALYASIGLTPRDGVTGPYFVGDKQWDEAAFRAQQTPAYLKLAGV